MVHDLFVADGAVGVDDGRRRDTGRPVTRLRGSAVLPGHLAGGAVERELGGVVVGGIHVGRRVPFDCPAAGLGANTSGVEIETTVSLAGL